MFPLKHGGFAGNDLLDTSSVTLTTRARSLRKRSPRSGLRARLCFGCRAPESQIEPSEHLNFEIEMISYLPSSSDISPVPPAPLEQPPTTRHEERDDRKGDEDRGMKEELKAYADNLVENVVAEVSPSRQQEPRETSKQQIRTRYLGRVTDYQPIRDQYFLVPGSCSVLPFVFMSLSQREDDDEDNDDDDDDDDDDDEGRIYISILPNLGRIDEDATSDKGESVADLARLCFGCRAPESQIEPSEHLNFEIEMISYLPSSSDISPVPPAPLEQPPTTRHEERDDRKGDEDRGMKEELKAYADNLVENVVAEVSPSRQQEPRETSKQQIRTRYLGRVTDYQPIRDQYFLVPGSCSVLPFLRVRSVPVFMSLSQREDDDEDNDDDDDDDDDDDEGRIDEDATSDKGESVADFEDVYQFADQYVTGIISSVITEVSMTTDSGVEELNDEEMTVEAFARIMVENIINSSLAVLQREQSEKEEEEVVVDGSFDEGAEFEEEGSGEADKFEGDTDQNSPKYGQLLILEDPLGHQMSSSPLTSLDEILQSLTSRSTMTSSNNDIITSEMIRENGEAKPDPRINSQNPNRVLLFVTQHHFYFGRFDSSRPICPSVQDTPTLAQSGTRVGGEIEEEDDVIELEEEDHGGEGGEGEKQHSGEHQFSYDVRSSSVDVSDLQVEEFATSTSEMVSSVDLSCSSSREDVDEEGYEVPITPCVT
eukprot:sb/3462559/